MHNRSINNSNVGTSNQNLALDLIKDKEIRNEEII